MRERSARCSKRSTSRTGAVEVPHRDRRLDRVAVDPPDRGLPEIDAVELQHRLRKVSVGGLRVAGAQLGKAEAAAPDHRHDRLERPSPRRGSRLLEPTGVRMHVGAPRIDPPVLDAELLECLAHLPGEFLRLAQASRPGLDHDAVEEDVRERGLVPLRGRLPLGFSQTRTRAVEVVDVAAPLAELEHEPRVDRGRRRDLVEPARTVRRLRVEALAEEEVGADPGAERLADESRLRLGDTVEQVEGRPGRSCRLAEVDGPGVHRDRRLAAALHERILGRRQRLLRERHRG